MDTIYYIVGPIILIAIALAAIWLERWSVPVILIALGTGLLFGSDVLSLWMFDDFVLTNKIANLALVFILFQGGFCTSRESFRSVALIAGGMATWGVVLTAGVSFIFLWCVLGWSVEKSVLLSVIISSTDAAATFSILRRQSLPAKLTSAIEVESSANDPMAVLLTLFAVQNFTAGTEKWYFMLSFFVWKFTAAIAIGWFAGHVLLWLFNHLRPQDRGYYYILTFGCVLLIFGITEFVHASGIMAVFIAGYILGNHPFIHKQGVANFSSALSILSNIGMFALLGLLAFPRQWSSVWVDGVVLFLVLTFIARPVAVLLGTFSMKIPWRHRLFMMWGGLRGAVPIVLSTYPAAAGMALGQDVFNMVFFAVLLSIAIQGATLGPVARWLGLSSPLRPQPPFNLELITMASSDMDIFVVDLPDPRGAIGPKISELSLPPGTVIAMITREQQVIAPKGSVHLHGWDRITVLAHSHEEETLRRAIIGPFAKATENCVRY